MGKRGLGLAALAVAVAAIAIVWSMTFWGNVGSPGQPPPSAEPLRVGTSTQPTNGLGLLARAHAFPLAHGLQVQWTEYASGKLALLALLAGEIDVAIGVTEVPLVMAAIEGADLRILAMTGSSDSIQRIVARRDAEIAEPADLRGKKVATQRGSAVHYFLHQFLLHNGMGDGDIELSYLPGVELTQALASEESTPSACVSLLSARPWGSLGTRP